MPTRSLAQQIPQHVVELMLSPGNVLVAMKDDRKFAVSVPMGVVSDERIGLKNPYEPFPRVGGPISDLG